MNASDLMTTDVETVSPDDEIGDVLTRLARADFNGFPVVENGRVVGIVTQHDLVHIFQPSDRTLWIPVGFPPFLETLEYAIDLSWDELDAELDLLKHAGKPVRTIMTEDVVTVDPDADLDRVLDLLADDERDINRLPVVEESAEPRRGNSESSRPSGDDVSRDSADVSSGQAPRDHGELIGIVARQDVLRAIRDQRRAD